MMTENNFAGLSPRHQFIDEQIFRIDGRSPDPLLIKHAKMAQSPFTFFRGSAQLFYADMKAGLMQIDERLFSMPLTCVVGDCHMSNFGFMTEEGSHGDTIIFAPNDFDDACVGHAVWDIVRFMVSLELARVHSKAARKSSDESSKQGSSKPVIDKEHVEMAMDAFLDGYLTVCERVADDPTALYDAVEDIMPGTRLHKFYTKACARAAGGEEFITKSALAKAVQMRDDGLAFRKNTEKFTLLAPHFYGEVLDAFAPYMDDAVIDIVQRNQAGTGSNNLERFYFLVGPARPHNETSFARCHIVEVKQQREAAPLFYYPDLAPVNRLNPAHLTARCQRKMKRRPDLLLDEAEWQDKHWLIRSRHHARVGISPEDVCMGNRSIDGGFVDFAQLCGEALAFAHCRGDRRSVEFELAAQSVLDANRDQLRILSLSYAEQVKSDYASWVAYFRGESSADS